MFRSSNLKFLKLTFLAQTLLILYTIPSLSGNGVSGDSIAAAEKPSAAEELIRGERLFYGLVYLEDKSINCAGCHNTQFSDTLNWNPSAPEIARKYLGRSPEDLERALINPSGEKISEVHAGFQLSSADIGQIKLFMDKLAASGTMHGKPVVTRLIIFIVAALLLLFSLTDLVITKKIRQSWIHYPLLLIAAGCLTYILVVDSLAVGHSPGYEPDQPIKFSHKIHAGQNQTDCLYCHYSAPYSKTAGIPSTSVCMNCHLIVRNGTRSGGFEISKVVEHFDSLKTIRWTKVYNLPDHVFFSHAQHVGAGGISCQTCHGPVETMDRIKLNQELTMGWCVNCHRTTDVHFNENKFYTEYRELGEKIRAGIKANVTVEDIGGTECMKCHY
jgi:hypothetical protein